MVRLRIDEMLSLISSEIPFEGVSEDYSFSIKIREYTDFVCGAIHDGHQFRPSLWDDCMLSEYERWYEEDPCTRQFIGTFPIVLAGRDSRFEYDLNRDPYNCIYEDAWGKKLWRDPLDISEQQASLQKHYNFYKVVQVLFKKLNEKFGRVLVFDMHSYNWKRWEREVPTWNLGTKNIDTSRFGCQVEAWKAKLEKIQMPYNISASAGINDTFEGNGYFLKYITSEFNNTLVLATEIAKIYCDELTGVIFPEIVHCIKVHLSSVLILQVVEFRTEHRC